MDHFRALSSAGEKSERGLELTETIIRLNPAHYTVWLGYHIVVRSRCETDRKELQDADFARAEAGLGGRAGTDE